MDCLLDIGRALVRRRVVLGLTQRELGIRVGVLQPQVARWEAADYRSASLATVSAVAAALGLRLGERVVNGELVLIAGFVELPRGESG